MEKIRSLDGLRATAILLVLFSHCLPGMHLVISNNRYNFLFSYGKLGVNVFFAISGYLITKLLLFEREKTGNISLKDFYLRRIFRIFPVFYLYILVIILLKCFFVPTLFRHYTLVIVAAGYLWNYVHLFNVQSSDHAYAIFGHFWSLAIEEQFYLFWPMMLIKWSIGGLKKIAIGILLITTFIRISAYFFMPADKSFLDIKMLQEGGDTILMGCLGALIENTKFFKEKVLRIIRGNGLICFLAIYLFIFSPLLMLHFKGTYNMPIGSTLDSICIIMLLFWSIYIPSKVSDILNSKVLVKIGVLSYSLYIWQELFLNSEYFHLWYNKFPLNICLVFVVAFVSYYVIEKPILRLKKRFTRV